MSLLVKQTQKELRERIMEALGRAVADGAQKHLKKRRVQSLKAL